MGFQTWCFKHAENTCVDFSSDWKTTNLLINSNMDRWRIEVTLLTSQFFGSGIRWGRDWWGWMVESPEWAMGLWWLVIPRCSCTNWITGIPIEGILTMELCIYNIYIYTLIWYKYCYKLGSCDPTRIKYGNSPCLWIANRVKS